MSLQVFRSLQVLLCQMTQLPVKPHLKEAKSRPFYAALMTQIKLRLTTVNDLLNQLRVVVRGLYKDPVSNYYSTPSHSLTN